MPREIEFPDPLQIPVFDNHTHLDISREGEPIDVAAALREAARVGVTRVMQIGCDLPSARLTIGLVDEHPVEGCHGERVTQFLGALEGDGSGEGEVVTPVDALARKPDVTRKTVQRNLFGGSFAVEDAEDVVMRVPVMDLERLPESLGEVDVPAEGLLLHTSPLGPGPEEVEPGLPDHAHARVRGILLDLVVCRGEPPRRRQAWGVVGVQGHPAEDLRVLVETDAPYLTPHPFRGATNAPVMLPLTVRRAAAVLGVSVPELCHQVNQTGERLYGSW